MVKLFPDRCKCISAVLLVTHCLVILSFGALFLFSFYANTNGRVVNGDPTLPELYLDFDTFSGHI